MALKEHQEKVRPISYDIYKNKFYVWLLRLPYLRLAAEVGQMADKYLRYKGVEDKNLRILRLVNIIALIEGGFKDTDPPSLISRKRINLKTLGAYNHKGVLPREPIRFH